MDTQPAIGTHVWNSHFGVGVVVPSLDPDPDYARVSFGPLGTHQVPIRRLIGIDPASAAPWEPGPRVEAATDAIVAGVLREPLGDSLALDEIAHLLQDPEWGAGMLEDIAELIKATGRTLENPTGEPTWIRH